MQLFCSNHREEIRNSDEKRCIMVNSLQQKPFNLSRQKMIFLKQLFGIRHLPAPSYLLRQPVFLADKKLE